MKEPLKIIIFDGSFKTTSFINRLVNVLAERHQVFILGFNDQLTHRIDNVHYVPLGSNENKSRFVRTSLCYALQSGSMSRVFSTFAKLIKGQRRLLQEQNLLFVLNRINPDIIHLQWVSALPWFEQVLVDQKIPLVLSQLGFQNNVRPFVDSANFKYLQNWYPKIAGFRSVSKAITVNSDKIWSSFTKIDRVIYEGLSLEEVPFFEGYSHSAFLKILSVGRGHWIKGYDYALQCCSLLKQKNISFQYTIVGGSGVEELQFVINDLGLEDCVFLVSQIEQKEVFKLMQKSSLLLIPSLEEGIPNVLIEAMALGLPVISTDCGGVSELIDNDINGWVVKIRDPQAIAESIITFSKLSLVRIDEVRIAARLTVEAQNGENHMAERIDELYYEVLSQMVDQNSIVKSNTQYK